MQSSSDRLKALLEYHDNIVPKLDKIVESLTHEECLWFLSRANTEAPQTRSDLFNIAEAFFIPGNDESANEVDTLHTQLLRLRILRHTVRKVLQRSNIDFQHFAVADAKRFENCIRPECRTEVLERLENNKALQQRRANFVGGAVMLHSQYTRKAIAFNAQQLIKDQVGVCANFALLGANILLRAMEENIIPLLDLKIVTHHDKLGSHTFLLIGCDAVIPTQADIEQQGATTVDLIQQSSCYVILDPWAAAMGHSTSSGVFTFTEYPFDKMTEKLICCYHNYSDNDFTDRINTMLHTRVEHDDLSDDECQQYKPIEECLRGRLNQLLMMLEVSNHPDIQLFKSDMEYVLYAALKSLTELDDYSLRQAMSEKNNYDAHCVARNYIQHSREQKQLNKLTAMFWAKIKNDPLPSIQIHDTLQLVSAYIHAIQKRHNLKRK